ncbi:MAG: urease accessory protein UreD [Solirubrobacteraceae bacterium]
MPSSSPPDQEGRLGLRFRADPRGRTALAGCEQRFPLRTTVPMYLDDADRGMAFVYVQNPTGGVFADDRLTTDVDLGRGTRVHLTTQSATKLYDMAGGHAQQHLRFTIADDAYLEHLPDALIPQAGARFTQRTDITLGQGAACVTAELVGPGRRARGERFGYRELLLSAEARRGGELLCSDALRLCPQAVAPWAPGALGTRDYVSTMLVIAPDRDVDRLVDQLDAALRGEAGDLGAAAALPNGAGALVRVLSATATEARRALTAAWRVARAELLDLPLPRVRK